MPAGRQAAPERRATDGEERGTNMSDTTTETPAEEAEAAPEGPPVDEQPQPLLDRLEPELGGADRHERESGKLFGFRFDGHPGIRHIYLPAEFEGHPLRKDFPMLAREVKPWPGLVDVEPIPGDAEPGEGETPDGGES